MPNRKTTVIILACVLIVGSASYLFYSLFLSSQYNIIQHYNWLRLLLFLIMHIFVLFMCLRLTTIQEHYHALIWIFQVSFTCVISFLATQIYIYVKRGNLFYINSFTFRKNFSIFEENWVAMYFQIIANISFLLMTSIIGLCVFSYIQSRQEQRFQLLVDQLRSEDYVEQPGNQQKRTCSICLTDLDVQRVYRLPCSHHFHKNCLIEWLKQSSLCPLCRNNIHESLQSGIGQNNSNQVYDQVHLQMHHSHVNEQNNNIIHELNQVNYPMNSNQINH